LEREQTITLFNKRQQKHSRCIRWGPDSIHKPCFGDVRLQNITVLAVKGFEDARLQTPLGGVCLQGVTAPINKMKKKCVLEVVTDATYLLGLRVRVPHCSGGIVWSGVDGMHWQQHNTSFGFAVMHTRAYFWFFGNSVFPLFCALFLMQG
jgi:hypothetical protein